MLLKPCVPYILLDIETLYILIFGEFIIFDSILYEAGARAPVLCIFVI